MIIIEVAGGLGNQLQQYALYRKFKSMGKDVKLDVSWFENVGSKEQNDLVTQRELELSYFDGLAFEACTKEEKAILTGKVGIVGKLQRKLLPASIHWFHENKMYHPELLEFENMYISGYFACEKYYADILKELRETIKFPISANPLNIKMSQEMEERQSVSVHIRRGDYLNSENAAMFGNICTDKYYETAIEAIKENINDAHFYIFSDDISYVKEKYTGDEYTIIDFNHGKDSFYDMWLMSKCKHNICANSTFSFWGARLNGNEGKIMIRPTIHKNSQIFVKEEMEDLWAGWKFVSPDGCMQ